MGDLPSVIKQSGQVQFSSSVSGFSQDDPRNKSENIQNGDLQQSCFLPPLLLFFDTGNRKFIFIFSSFVLKTRTNS